MRTDVARQANLRDDDRGRRARRGSKGSGVVQLKSGAGDLPPGERTWPYHWEDGCEEWVLAVSGRPTLRGPDGERELSPGDIAVFPEGPEGAHAISNDTDEPCRVLILSSKAPIAVVHYPESGKVGIWTKAGGGYQSMLRADATVDYWEGEQA